MSLVLILDSQVDKHLLSEGEGGRHNLVSQIKAQGSLVDSALLEKILIKYHLQAENIKVLKLNNFVLLEEATRLRVFLIE